MKLYGKQVVHKRGDEERFYLNPYTTVETDDDGVLVMRIDSVNGLRIENRSQEAIMQMFQCLQNGVSQGELTAMLAGCIPQEPAEDWINLLLQEGFIE